MDVGKIEFGSYTYTDGGRATDREILPTSWIQNIELPIRVKIWNKGAQQNPEYAKDGDAGMDIRADETKRVYPGETVLVKTGIHIALPKGYEVQVRPRSGQSLKTKIRVANSPGTIDSNYRGEICVIVDNIGDDPYEIKAGDRIAQIVLQKVPVISWQQVNTEEELGETNRGAGGFGSTGHN